MIQSDLFIPKRWRSPTTLKRVTWLFSPSQKGHGLNHQVSDLSLFSPCRKVETWRVLVVAQPRKPISACLELRKLQQFRVYGGKAIEGDILKGQTCFFSEGSKGQVIGNCSNWLVKVIWVETAVLMPIFDQDLVDCCHFQELGNCSTKEVMIFIQNRGAQGRLVSLILSYLEKKT